MVLTCVIIDDDFYIIDQLTDYISDIPTLNLIRSYTDSTIALSDILLMEKPIDILFTDIEIPKLNGLELATAVKHKIKSLILVSGHLQYAIDGYGIEAADFLLKPIGFEKFKSVVDRQMKKVNLTGHYIAIKTKGDKVIEKINKNKIIYIEADRNYVTIYTIEKSLTTLITLTEFEKKLKNLDDFIRIHKSFIINKKYIGSYNDEYITLTNGKLLPVGNTYLKALTHLFGIKSEAFNI